MRVHWLQHVPFEALGAIQPWLASRGAIVTTTRLYEEGAPFPRPDDIDWLIVMGGPMSVNDEAEHPWLAAEKRFIAACIAESKAVLGICLGAQLIAAALGARVGRNPEREIGWFPIEPAGPPPRSGLASVFDAPMEVFHWHGEYFALPPGATLLARSAACARQAFCIGERVLALQFHPEMTAEGVRALARHCPGDLAPAKWVQTESEMLADSGRFERAHRVMHALLERLEEGGMKKEEFRM